jgi:argininosuccinate lyase
MLATDVADYLSRKGMPFREAHSVVARVVRHCLQRGKSLSGLSLEEWKGFSPFFDKDVFQFLTPVEAVIRRNSSGGTSPGNVEKRLREIGV